MAWGAPRLDPVLQTSLWVECGLGGVLTTASSKHSLFVPKIQLMNLQHRTEPVSYTGMPFVCAFCWQIHDVPEGRKSVKLLLQLKC